MVKSNLTFVCHYILLSNSSYVDIYALSRDTYQGANLLNLTTLFINSFIFNVGAFYNAEDGSGYLAWRLKFVQKEASEGQKRRVRQSVTDKGTLALILHFDKLLHNI